MAYYRNYRNYPHYKKKKVDYKIYLNHSFQKISKIEKENIEKTKLLENFFSKENEYKKKIEIFNKKEFSLNLKYQNEFEKTNAYKELSKKIYEIQRVVENEKNKSFFGLFLDKQKVQNLENNIIKYSDELGKKRVKYISEKVSKEIKRPQAPSIFWYRRDKKTNKDILDEHYINDYQDYKKLERALAGLYEKLPAIQKAKEILFNQDNKIQKAKDESAKHKAHSYAYQEKTRELAEEVKREIKSQLNKFKVCPYCESDLGEIPHADHIYPVSKGGLSTKENMVYICQGCNSSKSDKTLNVFIKSKGLDRDKVESNLELLGKDF